MNYFKKVCVLKQVEGGFSLSDKSVGGIVRLESESGVNTLFLSVINIAVANGGCYKFFICDKNENLYCLPLGARPTSLTHVVSDTVQNCAYEGGFACGLFFIKDNLPTLVAFARTDNFVLSPTDLKKVVAEHCFNEHKSKSVRVEKSFNQIDVAEKKELPFTDKAYATKKDGEYATNETPYNDEAVATENYYDLDDGIREKLKAIGDFKNESIFTFDEQLTSRNKEEKEKSKGNGYSLKDETDFGDGKKVKSDRYFDTVKDEISDIFNKFEQTYDLATILPNSHFVKINYDNNNHYVVGVVKEEDVEKYVCYGVPATYGQHPPKELEGYCSFIPLSIYDLFGKGYWMMFQCAKTGECVKKT